MAIPSAPLAQLITCRNGMSFTDVLQRHHDAMEHKLDLLCEDGTKGVLILWNGANAFKAMLAAGEFQDKQRILQRRIDTDRQFDIVMAPTRAAFETSGKLVPDAAALLVISGKVTTGTPTEYFKSKADSAAEMGKTFGSIPGVISNLVLQGTQGREAKLIGGCYLFDDQQSMRAYLSSETWAKMRAETPWEDVRIEQYVIASDVPAAA